MAARIAEPSASLAFNIRAAKLPGNRANRRKGNSDGRFQGGFRGRLRGPDVCVSLGDRITDDAPDSRGAFLRCLPPTGGCRVKKDSPGAKVIYARYFLPTLTDLAMRNRELSRLRAQWIARARGEVLEIGIGSGLNLPYYSSEVRHIYGIDPSAELQRLARKRLHSVAVPVDFLLQSAGQPVPLPEESIDTVVVTWALCSIEDPARALLQARRVLKPAGQLIFIEHGRAPEAGVRRWQSRLTPAWKHIAGGCHLDRKVDDLIAGAGFQIAELSTSYLSGPRLLTFMYRGIANRGPSAPVDCGEAAGRRPG